MTQGNNMVINKESFVKAIEEVRKAEAGLKAKRKFVQTVDLIITGNSNVLSDAILSQKYLIYYWNGCEKLFDYNGIVQGQGIKYSTSPAELNIAIQNILKQWKIIIIVIIKYIFILK